MKKVLIAVAIGAVLLFGLVGCGSSSTSASDTAVTQPAPVETYVPPSYTPDEQYLIDIHNVGDSTIDSASDESLLRLGHNVCRALDSGNTVTGLVQYLSQSGAIDGIEGTAGVLIGAAVRDLCPEYIGQVNEFLNQYGY